jgi:DNA-binding MarR family transcriptional regulator
MSTARTSLDPARLTPAELAAWRGFLRVHAALIKELDAELEARHGLPLSSYEVLIALADAPGQRLRMAELADQALLSRSGMTRLVDRLQKQGLLDRERCDLDARGSYAKLSEKGRRLLAQARPAHLAGVRERFLRDLDDSEMEVLAGIWERLVPGAVKT